jgi:uncharacterized membrane protein YgcG
MLACLLGLLLPTLVAARTLNWAEVSVEARLDAEGRLHVKETQAMVFDGAWNGGERSFNLRGDQKVKLNSMTRIDRESGVEFPMRKWNLDAIDEYDWADRSTLRWRARLPRDPEFDNETIVYVLDYTFTGVVEKKWGTYVLDHDFSFPIRYGDIEIFTLDLEIDPVWRSREGLESRQTVANMPPGVSHVVTTQLDYAGSGRPSAVFVPPPAGLRLSLVGLGVAAIVLLLLRFLKTERERGRFDPPDVPERPSREWLEENLLKMRPEVAGALWDRTIAGPEVSALLARMVAEGKLASRVEKVESNWKKDILHLELLIDRDLLSGYERKLIEKLFFRGRTETSTEAVKKHYKSRGFSPTSTISGKLLRRTKKIPGFKKDVPGPSVKPGLMLLGVVLALVVIELVIRRVGAGSLVATMAMATFVPSILGYIGAYWRRNKAEKLLWPTGMMLVALGVILFGLWGPVLAGQLLFPIPMKMSWFGMAALLVFGVTVANSFFNSALSRDSREAITVRKRLAGIRRYFKGELEKSSPDLEDDWFPYLLAFGLADDVDKWSVAHARRADFTTTTSRGFSGGSSGSGWSGGGGAFGGAGASAGWAAAATGLAAGVASPGSSGGGSSGGGGGGGSSGGGGGGGW